MATPSQLLKDHQVSPNRDMPYPDIECSICNESVVSHPNGFTGLVHEGTMTKRWFAGPIDAMQVYVEANKHAVNLLYAGDATQGPQRYAVCSRCGLNVHLAREDDETSIQTLWVHGPELTEKWDARNEAPEPHAQKTEQANPYITVSDVTNTNALSAMKYTARRDNLRFEGVDDKRYVIVEDGLLGEKDSIIKRQAEQIVGLSDEKRKLAQEYDGALLESADQYRTLQEELRVMRGEIKPPWDEGSETGQDAESDDEPFMHAIYEPRYNIIEIIRATRDALL